MPLDHFAVTVPQSKFDDLVNFLVASLEVFGFKEHVRPIPFVAGLGDKKPYLWLNSTDPDEAGADVSAERILKKQHIAFSAETPEQVRRFHAAALKAGGIDNGAPGLRAHYHPGYYAAFVRDPVVGVNWEVVCHHGVKEP